MVKDIIFVSKDKCPLDTIAEMGSKTAKAWIFLHRNAIDKLRSTADIVDGCTGFLKMVWKETEKYPATTVYVENGGTEWIRVYYINASDIAFDYEPLDPKYLFFLKMED